jgi:SAM-dependent methyltransferase
LGALDGKKLDEILRADSIEQASDYTRKYADFQSWAPGNIRRILNLGLDFQPKKRVLDLGSGAGLFLYICKRLGHEGLGLDVPDPNAAWFAKMFELYAIPRVIWYINPFEPLPDLGPRFDYVTGFMICFNQPKSEKAWKIEEWRFFLDDLWSRLNPGAVVWFELNPGLDGAWYTPELKQYLESRGAIVEGKRLVWGLDPVRYRVLQRAAQLDVVAMRRAAGAPDAADVPAT